MGASESRSQPDKVHQNAHGTYTTKDGDLYDAACDDDLGKIQQLLAGGAKPDCYRHQLVRPALSWFSHVFCSIRRHCAQTERGDGIFFRLLAGPRDVCTRAIAAHMGEVRRREAGKHHVLKGRAAARGR